jgi:CspA family cold shock protein
MFGTVKHWNKRGFGFIERDDTGEDIFVHASALPRNVHDLEMGQRVSFEIGQGDKGPKAIKVKALQE